MAYVKEFFVRFDGAGPINWTNKKVLD